MALKVNRKTNGKEQAKPAADAFTVTIGKDEAIGAYKEGQTLTETRHIADLLRQHALANVESDEQRAKLENVDDAQIVAVARKTKVEEGQSPVAQMVGDILIAPFAVDTGNIPTTDRLESKTRTAESAFALGDTLSDDTVADLNNIVEAAFTADAGAVSLMVDFERDLGKVMIGNQTALQKVPPIGSKYQPSKKRGGTKVPEGYRLKDDTNPDHAWMPVWDGPWDYTQAEEKVNNKTVYTRWLTDFVSVKLARGLADELNHIRDAINNKTDPDSPQPAHIAKLREERDVNTLAVLEADTAAQFRKRERYAAGAFNLIQAKAALEEKFPNSKIELFGLRNGETTGMATRRRKPFCLVNTRKNPNTGTDETIIDRPVEASKITLAHKRLMSKESQQNKNLKIADLFATQKRKGADEGATNKDQVKTPTIGKGITTVVQFEDTLADAYNYLLNDKTDILRIRCNDPANGPRFCAMIVRLEESLSEVTAMEGVRSKASQYEIAVSKASSANATVADKEAA